MRCAKSTLEMVNKTKSEIQAEASWARELNLNSFLLSDFDEITLDYGKTFIYFSTVIILI